MTNEELSNTFDALLNLNVGEAFLDEYEKSVLLTEAQEDLVLSFYRGNNTGSFDSNEENKRNLSNLIKEFIKEIEGDNNFYIDINLPKDLWFIIYEEAWLGDNLCDTNFVVPVVPTTNDEYRKIKKNPFRGASKRRVLRLDTGKDLITLVSSKKMSGYLCRYISKPKPIVLIDFDEVSIDGINIKTECELPSTLHMKIVEMAVSMAITRRYNNKA